MAAPSSAPAKAPSAWETLRRALQAHLDFLSDRCPYTGLLELDYQHPKDKVLVEIGLRACAKGTVKAKLEDGTEKDELVIITEEALKMLDALEAAGAPAPRVLVNRFGSIQFRWHNMTLAHIGMPKLYWAATLKVANFDGYEPFEGRTNKEAAEAVVRSLGVKWN